jgi:RHS repeat-associated protein
MSMTVLAKRVRQSLNGVTTYTYNRSNELTNSTGSGSTTLYGYDAVGNMVSRNVTTIGTARWTYTWDVPGNLVKASNGTTVQGYYAYDGLGRMMEAKEASSTIFYAYHGTETLAEQIGSSGAFNDYIYTNGIRLARAGTYTNTVNYYHTDGLGSTRLRTDINGNVVFADGYQPFGQDNGTPAGSETYKFTGKPVSATTGLYYYYRRWYDSSIGRFISADPAPGQLSNPQTLNRYVYAVDRPTSVVDPTGLDSCDPWNPFTYGGCVNNGIQAVNNVVVQPAENFVNKHVVQPIVNNFVKPFINNVVVPFVKNVLIPLAIDYVAANNNVSQGLYQAGKSLYNGVQWSLNNDIQVYIGGLHSKDRNVRAFFECDVTASVLIGTAAAFYFGGAPVSSFVAYIAERGALKIPPVAGPPLGFFAGEYGDALTHLAIEGAQAFGGTALCCVTDLGGIANDAIYGSGAIPL